MQYPNQNEKTKYWRAQIAASESYAGPIAAFCRERNLSYEVFQYWRNKFKREEPSHIRDSALNLKTMAKPIMQRSSPFIAVEVERSHRAMENQKLPDPRWVAEFILHLHEVAR